MSINSPSGSRAMLKGALATTAMAAVLVGGGAVTAPAAQATSPTWAMSQSPTAVVVAKSYSRSTVAKHRTAANCWTIVDGGVYNLTRFIAKHPGGRKRIIRMCGKDASAAFRGQHSSASRASTVVLKRYRIGTVK